MSLPTVSLPTTSPNRMPPGAKIRITVQLGSSRHVVPIPSTHTVSQLADEISRRLLIDDPIRLASSDNSLLYEEDEVGDVLDPGDTVIVRLNAADASQDMKMGSPSQPYIPKPHIAMPLFKPESPPTKRVKIAIITPELAWNAGYKESSKVIAFDGSHVSAQLTFDVIKREALRSLGWLEDNTSFALSSNTTQQSPSNRIIPYGSCGCTVGSQLHSTARFNQLHCSQQIDGTFCEEKSCKYSHTRIASGILQGPPSSIECSICTELFGFPCHRCIEKIPDDGNAQSVYHCPLVQNAGCRHIFHAHCYFGSGGDRSSAYSMLGCPTGCPTAIYTREAVPFDCQEPHLLIVHSGSVVEKMNIPIALCPKPGDALTLSDRDIQRLIEERLPELGTGLVMRMFDRMNTGEITFRHSTVISICCNSSHPHADAIIRLPLFPDLAPPTNSSVLPIDFHTATAPILNSDPNATLEELGLDSHLPDGGEVVLYAVKRTHGLKKEDLGKSVGKSAIYQEHDDWHPAIRQSTRGMSAFLSTLMVFVKYLALYDDNTETKKNLQNRIFAYMLGLTRFPPAIRALFTLVQNEKLISEGARALSETMFHLMLDIADPLVNKHDKSRTFEASRLLFGTIIEHAKGPFVLSGLDSHVSNSRPFKNVSLTCELTSQPLFNPVTYGDKVVDRSAAIIRQERGLLYDPLIPIPDMTSPPAELVSLIRQLRSGMTTIDVFCSESYNIPSLLVYKLTPGNLAIAINHANVELQIHAPGGTGVCGSIDDMFLRPCNGGEIAADVNVVAARLQPIIEHRKAMGEWDIDAFGGVRADKVDTREVEEAIVIALDLSRSMEENFNEEDEEDEDDEDPDEKAKKSLLDRFAERNQNTQGVLPDIKDAFKALHCLPSIAMFIHQGRSYNFDWWCGNIMGDPARIQAATKLLDELVVILCRLHWNDLQIHRFPRNNILCHYENLVATILDPSTKLRVIQHLMQLLADHHHDWTRAVAPPMFARLVDIPMRFKDPFTGEIMADPVKASDGYTYERSSIEAWREVHQWSPVDPSLSLDPFSPLVARNQLNSSSRCAIYRVR
ncbi:hypothetical protein ABKN59_010554 [Abortiporus biennis]